MNKKKISLSYIGNLVGLSSKKLNTDSRLVEVKKTKQRAGSNNTEFKYIKDK